MRFTSSIALAAMAVVLATPGVAEAKAKHHHAAAKPEGGLSTAEQLQIAQEEISQLQAQLNALQDKIASVSTAQAAAAQGTPATQAVAAQAAAASAKADTALAVATAAQTAAANPPIPEPVKWAANTSVSGRMYFNASSVATHADGTKREQDGGFQIKRFYIGVDHKFNKVLSANVTLDIDNLVKAKSASTGSAASAANPSVGDGGTVQGFYVKKAYLDAHFNDALDVKLGSADLPWVPYVENIYGYRHVEKISADFLGVGTTADWGAHVSGKLAHGIFGYAVSAVDGGGYRQPQLTKTMDFEGRVSVDYKGFSGAVGYYTGKLGNDTQANNAAGVYYRDATRFDALAAYKGNVDKMPVTIGLEYLEAKNWKVLTTKPEDKLVDYSVFASISPRDKWSVFGRYDYVKPNDWTANAKKVKYYNLGVQWEPVKIVDLALVYKRYIVDGNGISVPSLGDYAAPANAINGGSRGELGVFGQLKF